MLSATRSRYQLGSVDGGHDGALLVGAARPIDRYDQAAAVSEDPHTAIQGQPPLPSTTGSHCQLIGNEDGGNVGTPIVPLEPSPAL